MKKNYMIIAMSCLVLAACSSGKNRLEKGDYDTAVYKAVNRLQQKPQHGKAEKVLQEAYTLAVNEHMEVIAYLDQTNEEFRYDRMVHEYEMVDYLNRAVRRYPMYSDLLHLTDVKTELAMVRSEAAFAHKNKGDELLTSGDKQRARDAYQHYVQANIFSSGTVSSLLLDKAQEAGTLNVVLEFANRNRFFQTYNTDLVFNHLRNGLKDTRYRFLRILEPGELVDVPDEIVQIEMDEAHVGGVDFSKQVYQLKKDNVYLGEAETDSGEVVEVYGTVTADYIEYSKTINAQAAMVITRLNGENAAVKQREIFPSSYCWTEKWATYRGDKRALTSAQLKFANTSEPTPPNVEWLFAQTTQPMVSRSIDFLRGQFGYLR